MKSKPTISPASYDNIKIIGINTSLIDFKLAWFINNKLSTNFVRHGNIVENGAQYAFFYFDTGETGNTYNLVSLTYKGSNWIRTSPRLDYMLIIRNYIAPNKLDDMRLRIMEIPNINYAFALDQKSIDAINPILDTIEMHEISIISAMKQRNTLKAVKEEMKEKRLNQPLQ